MSEDTPKYGVEPAASIPFTHQELKLMLFLLEASITVWQVGQEKFGNEKRGKLGEFRDRFLEAIKKIEASRV